MRKLNSNANEANTVFKLSVKTLHYMMFVLGSKCKCIFPGLPQRVSAH